MILNKKNKRNVHHTLVFECDDDYIPKVFPYAHECGNVPLDEEVKKSCHVKMMAAWGIGGALVQSLVQIINFIIKIICF